MTEVYGRKYELHLVRYQDILGNLDNLVPARLSPSPSQYLNPLAVNVPFLDATSTPSTSLVISGLNIRATVKWGKEHSNSNSQESVIEIYNLHKNKRKVDDQVSLTADQFVRNGDTIVLKAGYEQTTASGGGELPVIITGQVKWAATRTEGSNNITKIIIKDASLISENLRLSRFWTQDATYREIIEDLMNYAAHNGIPKGRLFAPIIAARRNPSFLLPTEEDAQLNHLLRTNSRVADIDQKVGAQGFHLRGYVIEQLNILCKALGYRAYTSLGKLYVEPIYSTQYVDEVVINSDNIKETIKPSEPSGKKSPVQGDATSGVTFKTFLNGAITLDKRLRINVDGYRGSYKITSIKHKLSLEGKDWDTEVECIKEVT
tara:strand:- start:2479 stop:3603 length:1125 start_codon:yes stop_codon:yes gene_type:complete